MDRAVQEPVVAALRDTPVVFVMGPRQAGKSTLVKLIAETDHPAEIFTFDTLTVREQAQNDPTGFLIDRPGNLVIDEVHHVNPPTEDGITWFSPRIAVTRAEALIPT
jgi:predicted AAA+ superfamily ATPase